MTVIIKLRGLPWSASVNEVREFFRGLNLNEEDIHLAPSKDGKASGIAFAVFHRDEDARKAMFRTGKYIGKRYVELALSSITEMEKYLLEGVPESRKQRNERRESDINAELLGRNGDVHRVGDRENGFERRSRSRSPLNRYRNYGNSDRVRYEPRRITLGVHSERDPLDRSSHGKGTFERSERRENGSEERRIGGERRDTSRRRQRSSGEESDASEASLICVRVIGLPFDARDEDVRRFFEGLNIVNIHFMTHKSGYFAGKPNGWGYVEFRSLGDCIHAESRNHQFIGKRYVEVKRCSREQMMREINSSGEVGSQRMNVAEHRRHEGKDSLWSPDDSAVNLLGSCAGARALGADNSQTALMMHLVAGANVSTSDDRTNCVVGIRNLPTSITAEEIFDFFYGFPVAQDSIRIHYLAAGRSSGDAMVTLPTASDAMNALEQLNHKPVGKRNVQLFLL